MSTNHDFDAWGRQLEAGQSDDDLLHLAAHLRDTPLLADRMPVAAKDALRQHLITLHPQAPRSFLSRMRSTLATAVTLTILAAAVIFAWMSIGSQPATGTVVSVTRPAQPTATPPPANSITLPGDSAVLNSPNITFDGEVTLAHITLEPPPYFAGNGVDGILHWSTAAPGTLSTALYLINSEGEIVAQLDIPLPSVDTDQPFQIPLPADLPPGSYDMQLAVYDVATGMRLATDEGETAVSLATIPIEFQQTAPQDTISIEQVSIGANTDYITDQKTMTVTVAVNLTSVERATAVANLLVREGADLMRGVSSGSAVVSAGDSAVTLTIPLTGLEVQPPATLLLIAELYAGDPSGPPLAAHTEPFYQWRYDPAAADTDTVALLEATQHQRHTAIVTFEVRLAVNVVSGDTAVLEMYLANPNWEENWEIADGLRLEFTPSATNPGTMRLTATPEQIRTVTATDNPILVVEMWPRSRGDSSELSAIAPLRFRFPECPMDLTIQNEIVCQP